MTGSIIHRMIFFELLKIFALSLMTLTGMFLLAGLVQEASQRGLSPSQILMAIPLLIPNTLPYTIPATTLFATCVVYGRMAHDNEILVLKAAGVNILHLLKPAILLGLITSGSTVGLYYDLIPRSQSEFRQRLLDDAEGVIYGILKSERALRRPQLPYVIFVREVQQKRLIDVVFKRRAKVDGVYRGYDLVALAQEATLRVDMENNQIIVSMERATVFEKDVSGSDDHPVFTVPLPESIFGNNNKTRPASMVWEELQDRTDVLRELVEECKEKTAASQQLWDETPLGETRDRRRLELQHHTNQQKVAEMSLRHAIAESYIRPALGLGCMCFVLIGCPVGIRAARSDYLSTFVVCFLPTVFLYYPLLLAGNNLARDGKISVPLGIFAADAILMTVALALVWRLMRR